MNSNPQTPKTPREELELKLTALLLGELPSEQAFLLQEVINRDPELAKLSERLKQTIAMVRGTESQTEDVSAPENKTLPEPLRMREEKRQKLLTHFKMVKPVEFERKPKTRISFVAVAAMIALLAILAAMLLPALSAKSKAFRASMSQSDVLENGRRTAQELSAGFQQLHRGGATWQTDYSAPADQQKRTLTATVDSTIPSATPLMLSTIKLPQANTDLAPSEPNTAAGGRDFADSFSVAPVIQKETKSESPFYRQAGRVELPQIQESPQNNLAYQKDDQKAATDANPVSGYVNGAQPTWAFNTGDGTKSADGLSQANNEAGVQLRGFFEDSRKEEAPGSAAPGGSTLNFANIAPAAAASGGMGRKSSTQGQNTSVEKFVVFGGGQGGGGGGGAPRSEPIQTPQPLSLAGEPAAIAALENQPQPQIGLGLRSNGQDTAGFIAKGLPAPGGAGGGGGAQMSKEMPSLNLPSQSSQLVDKPMAGRAFQKSGGALASAEPALDSFQDTEKKSLKSPKDRVSGSYGDHQKQGNVGLADGVAPQLSRRRLQEDSRNSGKTYTNDAATTSPTISANTRTAGTNAYSLGIAGYVNVDSPSKQTAESEAFRKRYGPRPAGTKELAQKKDSDSRGRQEFTGSGREKIAQKLDKLQVSNAFQGSALPLAEVVRELSDKSRQADPEKKGINFIIGPSGYPAVDPTTGLVVTDGATPPAVDPTTGLPMAGTPVKADVGASAIVTNFQGKSVRLTDALDAVVESSELPIKYSIEDYGVIFSLDESRITAAQANKQPIKPAVQDEVPAARPKIPPPIPQPEIQTANNAFSTFSLNVSDVSFKLAAASLERGQLPDPTNIRSEEFINAFDYRDPEPPAGVPVALAWERAHYPFAQNRDLLRFSIKTAAQGRQAGRPLNLVLLLDNSGSMERADRVQIIHEALKVLASQLNPQDTLSVVTFARTARLWVDGVPGSQAAQVAENLSGLSPEGGTNLEEAMRLAYDTARRHYLSAGINRVVLLTDGAANLGNVEPEQLKQSVEAHRKEGIALDCFGIGWEGYNDDLLEVLSRNGDGRYGFINTPEEAATEFVGQLAGALQVAASDVKVQVEFNPARVTAYRQIGYAKHQLTKEQFRDNTVDAAEIGAAESGNALYVIEGNPAGNGPLATVRVRYKVPGTTDYHEHEWAVPFNGNAVALEQASPAIRLAATASAFSEWLASSPYAAEVSLDRLLGYLSGVPAVYGADVRPQKLEWMIRQAGSLTGK
jgi:Mg-chelatase subunit ChlD/anti-sigma factor RsiW